MFLIGAGLCRISGRGPSDVHLTAGTLGLMLNSSSAYALIATSGFFESLFLVLGVLMSGLGGVLLPPGRGGPYVHGQTAARDQRTLQTAAVKLPVLRHEAGRAESDS